MSHLEPAESPEDDPLQDDSRWLNELSMATGLEPEARAPGPTAPPETASTAAPAPTAGAAPGPAATAPPATRSRPPAADPVPAMLQRLQRSVEANAASVATLAQSVERFAAARPAADTRSGSESIAARSADAQEAAALAIAGLADHVHAATERADRTTSELVEAIVALRATQVQTQEAVVLLQQEVAALAGMLRTAEGGDRLGDIEAGMAAVYRAVRAPGRTP